MLNCAESEFVKSFWLLFNRTAYIGSRVWTPLLKSLIPIYTIIFSISRIWSQFQQPLDHCLHSRSYDWFRVWALLCRPMSSQVRQQIFIIMTLVMQHAPINPNLVLIIFALACFCRRSPSMHSCTDGHRRSIKFSAWYYPPEAGFIHISGYSLISRMTLNPSSFG